MNALSMMASLFAEGKSYTFSNYFDLNVDIEDLLTHFGYTFQSQNVALPHSQIIVSGGIDCAGSVKRQRCAGVIWRGLYRQHLAIRRVESAGKTGNARREFVSRAGRFGRIDEI